jgi:hypothetical protein
MLRSAWCRSLFWRKACVQAFGTLGILVLTSRIVAAGVSPILAEESSGEGGFAIIEWAIVVVLVGVALFVICRSSRRN